MEHKLLLAKCVTLLYKENILKDPSCSSKALIETAVSKIQTREVGLGLGPEKDVVQSLKETVKELIQLPLDQEIDKSTLLQRIRINVGENDKLYDAIEKSLSEKQDQDELRKSIKSIRRSIDSHVKDTEITEIINKTSSLWNFNRDKIKDTSQFLVNVWAQLEPFASLKTVEDKAVIDEVRLGDQEKLRQIISNMHVSVTENRIFRTGFQGLNRMLQGGFRPGEFWIAPASLQHKYKTGLSQTLFSQVAIYNKPLMIKPGKKPAMVIFAFEDTTSQRMELIFKQQMFTDKREFIDVSKYSVEEIQNFVLERLSINGFEIFIYRIDPSYWTYVDLFNRIIDIEQKGYSIEFVLADYLEKIPTTGCIQSGPVGNDVLDLFSRVRNFFSARGITFITPHQLNTESKKLIRGTVTEDKFVQALEGKGYYKGTSQLDQIPDGILLSHVFKYGNKSYLAIQRDRHRISSIVDEKLKLMYLEFPKGMPIPDDLHSEDSTLYKLPKYTGNAEESLFSFDD